MGGVILVDLEDIQRIHSWSHFNKDAWTYPELTPDEEYEMMQDPEWFDKHPDKKVYPGPYLIRANDEEVWISRDGEDWRRVVQRVRYESVEQRQWVAYFDLYAEGIGLKPITLRNRFTGMRRRLSRLRDRWVVWKKAYPWDDGTAQDVWDSLYEHPWLETRVRNGIGEVRYVSRQ